MIQFAGVFPDEKIVVSLIRQLSWSHIIALIPLERPLQRDFYAEMCRIERWSVRTLRHKIGSMLYERNEGENPTIGMILCAGKKQEQIELLELGTSGIHVAKYLVELPPRKLLAQKLHRAVELARVRLSGKIEDKE